MKVIETDRFIIRNWIKEDDTGLVSARNHYSISKNLGEPNTFPYEITRAREHIALSQKEHNSNYAITIDNIIAGEIGLVLKSDSRIASVHFWIAPEYQCKNIATDALKLFTEYVFKKYSIWFLEASALKDNPASNKVLKKAGYIQKDVDEPLEVNVYFRVNTDLIWNKTYKQSHVRKKNLGKKRNQQNKTS